jgi:hypothetical protein
VPLTRWSIESDSTSRGSVASQTGGTWFQFSLAPGAPAGQFVAMAAEVAPGTRVGAIELTAASIGKPIRASLQLRGIHAGVDRRWRRSIYLDPHQRRISVPIGDMIDADRGTGAPPSDAVFTSVLLVVDTLNTLPGTSGEVLVVSATVTSGR